MEFNFSKLNDREFEALGASIIEKIKNTRVEIFKPGKDGGVDGRFWIGANKEGIIQCKHYVDTPYSTLIRKLKTTEIINVKKLNPANYIFITSKKLSRKNKQEIKSIFHPFIKREDDIWGNEDLTTFLSKEENHKIVEQNFKLWVTSASILKIIFNNAIKGRSESTIREIEEKAHKYAVTENHKKGLNILEEKNVIIMTGEPGIGKTTLANNLALFYTAKEYEFCDIEENISEAESIFREKEKKKILFYCDDFLGSNMYDAINNKRDSHIVKFINRVQRDNSKKFILTSRTNILNKAYSLSHRFQNENIRDNELLLTVENLSNIDKAQILYNHIYHSNLKEEYIDVLYKDKRYRKIVSHRNFNPRIIEFVTNSIRLGPVAPNEYWKYVEDNLNNPEDIWADYFQNQTDDCVRALIYLTVYNKGRISEELLRDSYNRFLKIHKVNLGDTTDKSFDAVRKLASKSLLNRNHKYENEYVYVLFNPSIADFVINSYSNDTELITHVLSSLGTETSINYFYTFSVSKKINAKCFQKVHENLFDYFFEPKMVEEDWDFLISLSYIDFLNEKLTKRIQKFITALINADKPSGNNLSELLFILTEFELKTEIQHFGFLHKFTEDLLEEDAIKDLLNFIDKFKIDDEILLSQVETQIEDYLEEMVDNNDLEIDFESHINHFAYPELDISTSGIESDILEKMDSFLDGFNKSILDRININTSSIISSLDFEDMANEFFYSQEPGFDYDEDDGVGDRSSTMDDIDYIFER